MGQDQPAPRRFWARLLGWTALALALAVFLAPLTLGHHLRQSVALGELDRQRPGAPYRLLPLLSLTASQVQAKGAAACLPLLERVQSELEAYQGTHPAIFWMQLALWQAQAGQIEQARASLQRAQGLSARIAARLAQAPAYDPFRQALGLEP